MKFDYSPLSPEEIAADDSEVVELFKHSRPLAASIAVITNEADDLFITLGSGDHTSQRWKLTPSLARKLRRELNERLD